MKYFIGIAPSKKELAAIAELRSRYPGRLGKHVEPHVTIVPPYEYPEASLLTKGVLEGLADAPMCQLQLGSPAYFGKRVLFLSVKSQADALPQLRNSVLRAINDRLSRAKLPQIEDARSFHPHLTLAMASFGTPYPVMEEMAREAEQLAKNFAPFVVEALRVYVRGAHRWEVWRDFPLGRRV